MIAQPRLVTEHERIARFQQKRLDRITAAQAAEQEARRRAQTGEQEPTPQAPYEGDFERVKGQLDWPLRGELVGQFGNEKHPRFGTVTFNNGIDVRLPAQNPDKALALLTQLDRDKQLMSRDIVAIDMRLPDRVSVRLSEEAGKARDDLMKKNKKAGSAA